MHAITHLDIFSSLWFYQCIKDLIGNKLAILAEFECERREE
jgi:hypothetical protein